MQEPGILERCIMLAIDQTHQSDSPNADPIIELIYGALSAGYIDRERAELLISGAQYAELRRKRAIKEHGTVEQAEARLAFCMKHFMNLSAWSLDAIDLAMEERKKKGFE